MGDVHGEDDAQMADPTEFFRKQPQQSRSRALVNAILGAAEEFVSRGEDPDAVSLQGIARRAGVGIGSLYDYFSSRDGVLGALLSRITDDNFERLEREVSAHGPLPFDQLVPRMVDATMRLYLDNPKRTRTIVLTIVRLGWMKRVVAERDRFAAVLAKRLRESHPEVDPRRAQSAAEVLCDALMGVVLAELWRERTADERARIAAEVHALVASTLASVIPPRSSP